MHELITLKDLRECELELPDWWQADSLQSGDPFCLVVFTCPFAQPFDWFQSLHLLLNVSPHGCNACMWMKHSMSFPAYQSAITLTFPYKPH